MKFSSLCGVLVGLLLAGCGNSGSPTNVIVPPLVVPAVPAPSSQSACHDDWPVVAHQAGGGVVKVLRLPLACAQETGYATSESTFAITGNGTLLYSPAQTENTLARSTDGGASWQLTGPTDAQITDFWNTVDPYLINDRRTGHVFWAHATGPVRQDQGAPTAADYVLGMAYGFEVYRSADDGATWSTANYQSEPVTDWEQLMVGPAPAASAQPVGYPNVVYLCGNAVVTVAAPSRICYKSLDGGVTFTMAGLIAPSAANPAEVCPPLNFQAGVVDSHGTLFIPATCEQNGYLLVSHDEGATWSGLLVPGAPGAGAAVNVGFLQLAVDDADTLYAMWQKEGLLYLARSLDAGKTWDPAWSVGAPGVTAIQRPTIKGGAAGRVAMAYYGSTDASAVLISAYVSESHNALDAQPLFYSGMVNHPAAPLYHDYGIAGGTPRVDYIGSAYDGAGTQFRAALVKQLGPPDASDENSIATTGYIGFLDFD